MKKKIIGFIIGIIILNIFNLVFTHEELFDLLIVGCLYTIFICSFSHIKYLKKYSFTSFLLLTLIISFIYFLVSITIGYIFFPEIKTLFLVMGISILVIPCINLYKDTMTDKKKKIINISLSLVLCIAIITTIILKISLKINVNIVGSIIFLSEFIILIPIIIFNRKLLKKHNINLKSTLSLFSKNVRVSLIKISNICYYYLSIMMLYFYLINIYQYYDKTVTTIIVDVYLFSYYIIIFMTYILYPKEQEENINNLYIKVIKKSLPILILISIISGPILLVLFNNNHNAYLFSLLIFEVLFLIMYNIAINKLINKKNFNIVLLIGIILKCILTIPLIKASYRMGYSMIFGDIVSTMISLLVVVLITVVYFNKIKKLEFSKYFSRLFNVIYENIILCLILILLQLLIPVIPNNYIHAIGIIIVYTSVFLIFDKIKKNLKRKK